MDSIFNTTSLTDYDHLTNIADLPSELCRERHGEHPAAIYNIITCALCYTYLYSDHNISLDEITLELVTGTNMVYPEGTRMHVDPDNSTAVSHVCGSLSDPSTCWMWTECCLQARLCCQEQNAKGPKPYEDYGRTLCPRTWDGYACWPDTPAGQRPRTECPAYIESSVVGGYAYKTCTWNATWYLSPTNNKEWTDYGECSSFEKYKRLHKASVACNIITIILLVPACFIFIYFRQLRQQHRIRLHICLMISSFLNSTSSLLWELLIAKDILEVENRRNTISNQNMVDCRLHNVVIRYAELASFMWMFIEGFHLHRLLVHAFTVPKTLIPYYIFGFGFPLLPVTVYSLVRATNSQLNKKCWIDNASNYEWIIYAPSLTALVVNTFFLLRIVFIMVRQLEPHPNEPNSFRRAVKAIFVLMPLFGAQSVLFVYRPPDENLFTITLELLSKICSSLQGAFIAITVCYLSNEVHGFIKTTCFRYLRRRRRKDMISRSFTITTNFGSDLVRTRSTNGSGDLSHMVALRPIYRQYSEDKTNETSTDLLNGNINTILQNIEEDLPLNHENKYSENIHLALDGQLELSTLNAAAKRIL